MCSRKAFMVRESLMVGGFKFMKAAGLLPPKMYAASHKLCVQFGRFMAYDSSKEMDLKYRGTFCYAVLKRCLYFGWYYWCIIISHISIFIFSGFWSRIPILKFQCHVNEDCFLLTHGLLYQSSLQMASPFKTVDSQNSSDLRAADSAWQVWDV